MQGIETETSRDTALSEEWENIYILETVIHSTQTGKCGKVRPK
jgi:hypothetical protein